MANVRRRGWLAAVSTAMVAISGLLVYACSSDDENPATTRTRTEAGADATAEQGDTSTPTTGSALCAKYGNYDKVKEFADAILESAKGDCRIGASFAALDTAKSDHLKECFEIFVGSAFQCEGVAYVSNTTKDSKNEKCRDMTAAHKELGLRKADFEAFTDDIAATLLAKGVSEDDLRAVGPAFEGARNGVVRENTQPDRNTYCTCPGGKYMDKPCTVEVDAGDGGDGGDGGGNNDAGGDGGSGDAGNDGGDAGDAG